MSPFCVVHSPSNPPEFQFTVEPHDPSLKAEIDAIRHWKNLAELTLFAETRYGFGDSDGYFGVTYPEGSADTIDIPSDHIKVDAGYGDPHAREFYIKESDYLELLRQYLLLLDEATFSNRIERLLHH